MRIVENDKAVYTAGIFAKKAGITLKTIHHYHKEGLLCPSSYTDSGYRLYSDEDFQRLQKILTLKFIGFSLEEIKELIKSDYHKNNIRESLNLQMDIIDEKVNHLFLVKKAINEGFSYRWCRLYRQYSMFCTGGQWTYSNNSWLSCKRERGIY